MEFPAPSNLIPYKYFKWKTRIILHLRGKGLSWIVMDTEVEATSTLEKSKYLNHMDEAHGLLCMNISPNLWLHINAFQTPNEI
jgi:hypothetical protein